MSNETKWGLPVCVWWCNRSRDDSRKGDLLYYGGIERLSGTPPDIKRGEPWHAMDSVMEKVEALIAKDHGSAIYTGLPIELTVTWIDDTDDILVLYRVPFEVRQGETEH